MDTLLKLVKYLFLVSPFGICEFVLQAEEFCPTCGKPLGTNFVHLECFKAKNLLYFQIAAEVEKGRLSQEDRDLLKNTYIAAALFQGIVVSIKDVAMGSLKFSPTNHPKIMEWKTLLARYIRSYWNCLYFADLLYFNLKLKVTIEKKITQQEHDTALASLNYMIEQLAQKQAHNHLKYILRDLCFPALILWGVRLEGINNILGNLDEESLPQQELLESLDEQENVLEDFKNQKLDSIPENPFFKDMVWYAVTHIRNERELIPFIKKVGQCLGVDITAQEEPFPSPTPLPVEPTIEKKRVVKFSLF